MNAEGSEPGRFGNRHGASRRVPRLLLCLLLGMLQPTGFGCFFRGGRATPPTYPTAPIRLVLMPPNLASGAQDLEKLSLATPILLAQLLESAPDLEAVPFWETFPAAKQIRGNTRRLDEANAMLLASQLGAQWCVMGELEPAESELSLLLDFVPARRGPYPFRFQKEIRAESLGVELGEALQQFIRYVVARPMKQRAGPLLDPTRLHEAAAAIDQTYGWFRATDVAGKPPAVPTFLDSRLAQLLFPASPAVVIAAEQIPQSPATLMEIIPDLSVRPAEKPPAPSEKPVGEVAAAKGEPAPETSVAALPKPELDLPPPKTFYQRLGPAPTAVSEAPARPTSAGPAKSASSPPELHLQVFASQSEAGAQRVADVLRKAGWNPAIVEAALEGRGTWYRVRLTGFDSRKAAASAGDKLMAQGLMTEYWIVRP